MTQKEGQADSEAQEPSREEIVNHYTRLIAHHYQLRKVVELDFMRVVMHLKEARESSRSDTLEIINNLITQTQEIVTEMKKARLQITTQMSGIAEILDRQDGDVDEMFKDSSRLF